MLHLITCHGRIIPPLAELVLYLFLQDVLFELQVKHNRLIVSINP